MNHLMKKKQIKHCNLKSNRVLISCDVGKVTFERLTFQAANVLFKFLLKPSIPSRSDSRSCINATVCIIRRSLNIQLDFNRSRPSADKLRPEHGP